MLMPLILILNYPVPVLDRHTLTCDSQELALLISESPISRSGIVNRLVTTLNATFNSHFVARLSALQDSESLRFLLVGRTDQRR